MTDAVIIRVLITLIGLLVGGNLWFMRRLVESNERFQAFVRERLEEHGTALASIEERHRLEDSGAFGRRWYDPRPVT